MEGQAASQEETAAVPEKGWLKRRRWAVVAAAVAVLAIAALIFFRSRGDATRYVTAPVSRGDVVQAIVTSGTINPLTTVQVGSYVSGTIESLSCDYNTRVKAGQVCARIDPRPYQLQVDQSAANLAAAEAQMKKDEAAVAYARLKYDRDLALLKKDFIAKDAADLDKNALDQALAQVALDAAVIRQRKAAHHAAVVNLNYTAIASPVDGIVISRSIDVGQTVAASFQTPTLFLIARDLDRMQIDTSVAESDVSGVRAGQPVQFTVEAFPDRVFRGTVTQVRKAPVSVQNVITYNAVVGFDNRNAKLLPGMTANVRIITAARRNVLRVPLQALRFRTEADKDNSPAQPARGERGVVSAVHAPATHVPATHTPGSRSHVYVLRDGIPVKISVQTGMSDGAYTEILSGGIRPGDAVIVNAVNPGEEKRNTAPQRPPMRF